MAHRWNTLHGTPPRIIAHRGASAYRPEHTLEGYALAVQQGADAIEPDVLMSHDGVLFARHDYGLAHSTDVAARPAFAARAREIDGRRDWWISDFTAAEIDSLRATQPLASRGTQYDGRFEVPRLRTLVELVLHAGQQHGRRVAVDIELKHPEIYRALGQDIGAALAAELEALKATGADAPVWLECFDHDVLRRLHARCGNACFALTEMHPSPAQLREIAAWARGVAPAKSLLWDNATNDTGLVDAAHALGLEVHVWTFREDRSPAPFATNRAEMDAAFALGVDALFCDFPDVAVAARAAFGGLRA
jgi:glycerophosphoryl diester phosphodiesterase